MSNSANQAPPLTRKNRPEFDSPSIFLRLLDKDKGGYFSIRPAKNLACTTKQQYLPSSNILQTRYIHEDGVVDLIDFFPRPKNATVVFRGPKQSAYREVTSVQEELKRWLVRRVECIRGRLQLGLSFFLSRPNPSPRSADTNLTEVEVFPAFHYAQEPHVTTILQADHHGLSTESKTVTFHGETTKLQLDVSIESGDDDASVPPPTVCFKKVKKPGMLGEGVVAFIDVSEGQAVSFVLRNDVPNHITPIITSAVLDAQQHDTQTYWYNWISKSKYKGRWREVVSRSLMILKLMTYEPTGAIIAAPTFSIPEDIGGVR